MQITRFPSKLAEDLGCYVYVYIDPRNDGVFYIGKGIGQRCFSHLSRNDEGRMQKRIEEIRLEGKEPRIEILAFNLENDLAAIVEAAAIDLIGINNLCNEIRGADSRTFGRFTLETLLLRQTKKELKKIDDDMILIRINSSYRPDMSALELYEVTRGIWVVKEELTTITPGEEGSVKYACAVYQGVIREVYEIASWHREGSTFYSTRDLKDMIGSSPMRYEFVGKVADNEILKKYKYFSLPEGTFSNGNRNPITYVGPSYSIKK